MKEICVLFLLLCPVQSFVIVRTRHGTYNDHGCPTKIISCRQSRGLEVWVEEAEDGFVDHVENLEEGEVCLLSLKAFASDPDDINNDRLLCAGALVQRPSGGICDAWTADAILPNGGPNLQLSGAVKLLDALFLHHLNSEPSSPSALRNFVLQCGSPRCDHSCASYMAGELRGFRRLREMVRVDSIYEAAYYGDTLDGMVFDYYAGKRIYERVARTDEQDVATEISTLLPDAGSIDVCTVLKEQERD